MIARLLAVLALAVAATLARAGEDVARIVHLGLEDDPLYEPVTSYTGVVLRDVRRPVDGARLAVSNARILSRALGIKFELEKRLLDAKASPAAEVEEAFGSGALAVLLDLPDAAMADALTARRPPGAILFNIRSRDPRWRGADCAPDLLHTMPTTDMLSDALAQHMKSLGWDSVLLLHGQTPEDEALRDAARASIRKFGLRLAAERAFELTNDPRRRDQANLRLLTGDASYDVIWLIDAEGEFGRFLPYATYLPRPVIGSVGLRAMAWHANYERHGAPQLNQRFRRLAKREMSTEDWAAWAAARSVVDGVSHVRSVDREKVAEYLQSDGFSLDLYKGVPGSYRPWDGQLRQPLLLATHGTVIAWAPLSGFEHRSNTLDTLGRDRSETECTARRGRN